MDMLASKIMVIARDVLAKERPQTLFEATLFDLRAKAKAMKMEWEKQVATSLENEVVSDLRAAGVDVLEAKLSMGSYRGSGFVTSFKLVVAASSDVNAEKLATYLRGKYSPKWKVKSVNGGIAELNVR